MGTFALEATEDTPKIRFDFNENRFSLSGESYPENTKAFYEEPLSKLKAHFAGLSGATVTFDFSFTYFHSSTARILLSIFDLLDGCAAAGNEVQINWCFESGDENMEEFGEEFGEDLVNAKLTLQEIPEP